MPARTGAHYIADLQKMRREIWIGGERVDDVTTHPATWHVSISVASKNGIITRSFSRWPRNPASRTSRIASRPLTIWTRWQRWRRRKD